jgi:hypothetical protein
MKMPKKKLSALLVKMGQIERMERGSLCRMGTKPYYNLQSWEGGRNHVRYVPADQAARIQEAIDGYDRFMELARQYADAVIERTRSQMLNETTACKPPRSRKKGGAARSGEKPKDV